jgi:transposase
VVCIGVDNGRTSHQYCILHRSLKRSMKGVVSNKSSDFLSFCQEVQELFPDEDIVVGIEEGGGMSSPFDVLMQQYGWTIRQLNPKAVSVYRESVLRIHDKTDETDAFTMAKMVEADAVSLELSHERVGLRRATRWRSALVAQQTHFINQLRATLALYWPETAGDEVFPKMDQYWVLDLLARYPDPAALAEAGTAALVDLLRGLGSRVSKRAVERIVRAAQNNTCFATDKAVLVVHTRHLALLLRQVMECIQETEKTIRTEVECDPDVQDIDAIKGIGPVQASTFVAEVRTVARFKNDSHMASYGGFGRRKVQTGKTRNTNAPQRHANRYLKRCLMSMAETLALHEDKSRRYYKKKLAEGKEHRQALRALGRHLVRRLYAILARNRRKLLQEAQPQLK